MPHFLHALVMASSLIVGATGQGPMFTDVTAGYGIPPMKYAEGVNALDLSGDGFPDLFLPDVKGRDRLFKNISGLRFRDVTDSRGITESGGIGAVAGDVDGDGRPDLYVVKGAYPYGVNVLYRHGPDGVFKDATAKSGTANRKNGISAVMADLDGDGLADIFCSNWGVNTFFRNTGGGVFVDASAKAGLGAMGRSWGAAVGDFNGDGLADIFVSRGGADRPETPLLYINKGGGVFDERGEASGLGPPMWSMGAIACDFDGDGDLDIYATGYTGLDRLYINDGAGRFTRAGSDCGITSYKDVGVAVGDIDGDLLPEIVVAGFAGPVKVYKNLGHGKFRDITQAAGLGGFSRNEGVALADFDGDGDLDIYVANYDGNNRLYRNNLNPKKYIKVRPTDGKGPAIGAVVRLYKKGGLDDAKSLMARVDVQAGFGFCSQGPSEAVFALPDDGKYDLSVTFPDGAVARKKGIGPGVYKISRPVK